MVIVTWCLWRLVVEGQTSRNMKPSLVIVFETTPIGVLIGNCDVSNESDAEACISKLSYTVPDH